MSCWGTRQTKESIHGDLFIEKRSFDSFAERCSTATLIGVTKSKTEHPLFVEMDEDRQVVTGFTSEPVSEWEWCGIAYIHDFVVDGSLQFVSSTLERSLPLKDVQVECFEIDTPADYKNARDNFFSLGYE